jgi:hypothetical protein
MNAYQVKSVKKRYKRNGKRRGIECKLSAKTIRNLAKQTECPFTGIKFKHRDPNRTLDRIDNNKGYIDGNVIYCHRNFNECFKDNLELEEIEVLYKLFIVCGLKPTAKEYQKFNKDYYLGMLESAYNVYKKYGIYK